MFHVVLYQPEIPPNTGNIIRLCANTGTNLHLIHPIGFDMSDKALRRAGLDYREFANICEHASLSDFMSQVNPPRLFAISTKGRTNYTEVEYTENDAFLFGPETKGLPQGILNDFESDRFLRIPMQADSRSLNLSNSAAVIVYEAWRQNNFQCNN